MSMNTKAEVRRRVGIVYKMLLDGVGRQEIIATCNGRHGWKASDRTFDNYIAAATARFLPEVDDNCDVEKGKALARYLEQYRLANDREDHRGATQIIKEIVALLGLAAPQRKEHSGPGGGPIPVQGALHALEEEIVAVVIAGLADNQEPGTPEP